MNWKAFLIVDFKDMSNWIALAIAIPLLIWGIRTLVKLTGIMKGVS
ncbi:hypothetical protein HYU17_04625 [Candidatus Woesearchaeota archaeon]|nr:hypothetical protein [Candidatus Woesearchaeota archaeon]